MKLFQTKRELCAYSALTSRNESAVRIVFRPADNGESLEFTLNANDPLAAFPLGERERADCINLYLTVTAEKKLRILNKYADTYYTKTDGLTFWDQINEPILAQIYIPYADATIDEMSLRVNTRDDVSYNTEEFEFRGEVEHTLDGFHAVAIECLPSVRVAEVTEVDGKYSVTAQLTLNGEDVQRAGVRLFAKSAKIGRAHV